MKLLVALLVSVMTLLAAPAFADEIRTKSVHFAAGASGTVIKDRIRGRDSVSYTVGANAGQRMNVRLKADNGAAYFNVYAPGRGPGDEALAVSDIIGPMVPDTNRFSAKLPASGVYTINVYLFRSAARRGETANYTLEIEIPPSNHSSVSQPVQNDFADGLEGGPDYWQVTRVPSGDTLNMRDEPSTAGRVVARFRNGEILRNRGCRMAGGQRWCRVEAVDNPDHRGWVAGSFLMEGSYDGGSANAGTGDATVPGTSFNATGMIPCARFRGQPMGQCKFGVERQGRGKGVVTVFWPDGGSRAIFFENGRPAFFDQSQADGNAKMSVTNDADLWMVKIGDQRFEIPSAVINGG